MDERADEKWRPVENRHPIMVNPKWIEFISVMALHTEVHEINENETIIVNHLLGTQSRITGRCNKPVI